MDKNISEKKTVQENPKTDPPGYKVGEEDLNPPKKPTKPDPLTEEELAAEINSEFPFAPNKNPSGVTLKRTQSAPTKSAPCGQKKQLFRQKINNKISFSAYLKANGIEIPHHFKKFINN